MDLHLGGNALSTPLNIGHEIVLVISRVDWIRLRGRLIKDHSLDEKRTGFR